MKSSNLSHLLLICLFQCCTTPVDDPSPKEDNSMLVYEDQRLSDDAATVEDPDTSVSIRIGGEEVALEDIEAGVETAIDITKTIADATNELLESKRRKDSVKLSLREKMFAYRLGVSVKNEKLVLEAYSNLSDKEGVFAFKRGRREYFLVKYQDKSEEDLDRELNDYKEEHSGEVIGEIRKTDLMKECGKRKTPGLTSRIKSRKNKIQLDCLTCQ